MKGESSCGTLCQHPECWRAKLQSVKDAVRLRNGIHAHQTLEPKQFESSAKQSAHCDDGSLPTLKVVNMLGDTDLRPNSTLNKRLAQSNRYHQRSMSLPSLSPGQSQPSSPSHSPIVQVPRPSPVSPTVLTNYQKRMLWKRNVQSAPDPVSSNSEKQHASIVGVHELYENDELLQDWRDVYITSAYLIWCQTNRRKKRKAKSTGSIRKDPRRVTFKDVTEDMVPVTMEKIKPKRPEPRRSPTVGQPYSPSRASSYRRVHVQHLDLADYGLEDFGDFPKSVIAGILQHFKPSKMPVDKELPLGLEVHPKQQSSPRARATEAKSAIPDLNKQLKTTNALQQTLEQTVNDENSRMLLDVDINSHITPPLEEPAISEEGGEAELSSSIQGAKTEPNMVKAAREKLAARQDRVLLPLASVGVPTQFRPKVKLHHCMNSIPRILDLGVAMEPVDVVSVSPSPTGTPAEEVAAQDSQLCVLDDSFVERALSASEPISPSDDTYWPVRGHVTSALRYSPSPVRAPAPTPISPERYGQYSRTSHSREHGTSIASRQMRTWGTLSNVNCRDEAAKEKEDEAASEPVFITEDVTHDPILTPLSNRKDIEEWPEEKMIINIIENGDDIPRSVRSPSPGSKTYIPHDILAEFHGDLYGRRTMLISGRNMMDKQSMAKESQVAADAPAYIAPAWRPPRSRTPIQFSETPSRKAPKPLRQPPAASVPRSLCVQSLAKRASQRPKSTPLGSSRDSFDLPLQQILSDSSLVNLSRDNIESQSMAVETSSLSADTCGSIPPPPSPEVPIVSGVAPRLDPLSEVEERSSLTSSSIADGMSPVEGCNNNVANLSEVENDNDEAKFKGKSEKVDVESIKEGTDYEVKEMVERAEIELKETQEPPNTSSQYVGEDPLSTDEKHSPPSNTVVSETPQNDIEAPSEELENRIEESGKTQDEVSTEINTTTDESSDMKQPNEEAIVPPHPPGSPDIINIPDFTEGLDMNLDLEAEMRAAMEGLDDLDETEADEQRASPKLEAR